jgi:hypothetical protein
LPYSGIIIGLSLPKEFSHKQGMWEQRFVTETYKTYVHVAAVVPHLLLPLRFSFPEHELPPSTAKIKNEWSSFTAPRTFTACKG